MTWRSSTNTPRPSSSALHSPRPTTPSSVSPVADLPNLEYLFLQALRQVEALPNMSLLVGLRRLWLETMKGITDLAPVRDAPNLRQLAVVDMNHLQPDAFAPLAGKATLESLRAGLGSRRKDEAVDRLMRLPRDGDWTKPLSAWNDRLSG